jgi:hypothetical protein
VAQWREIKKVIVQLVDVEKLPAIDDDDDIMSSTMPPLLDGEVSLPTQAPLALQIAAAALPAACGRGGRGRTCLQIYIELMWLIFYIYI